MMLLLLLQHRSVSEISTDHHSTLWEMVDKVDGKLNQNEKEQLYALLLDYSDIYAQSSDDFGQTGRIQHRIDKGDSQPIHQQTRRMPTFQKDEARRLVKEMLDKDVIQPIRESLGFSSGPHQEGWIYPILCGLQTCQCCY